MDPKYFKAIAVLIYAIAIIVIYSPVLIYAYHVGQSRDVEGSEKTTIVEYGGKLPDKVVEQKVETTFHDYTVVIRKGKVVANGVIHHANCKCKSK